MNEPDNLSLIQSAVAARNNAYAVYSNFAVGAALQASDGTVFAGCNIENASYGLTICAERVAVGIAVAAGQRSFESIAIASEGAATPCGACRQVLAEFCDQLEILLVDADGQLVRSSTLNAMLPDCYGSGK